MWPQPAEVTAAVFLNPLGAVGCYSEAPAAFGVLLHTLIYGLHGVEITLWSAPKMDPEPSHRLPVWGLGLSRPSHPDVSGRDLSPFLPALDLA